MLPLINFLHLSIGYFTFFRTWMQWFNGKVLTHTECSFSAVAVVWWASTVISPFVTKVSKNKNHRNMDLEETLARFFFRGIFSSFLFFLPVFVNSHVSLIFLPYPPLFFSNSALPLFYFSSHYLRIKKEQI